MTNLCRPIVFCLVSLTLSLPVFAQEITSKQSRQVKAISKQIDKAVRYFDSEKFGTSARELGKAYDRVMKLAAAANPALSAALNTEYDRISEYHKKLKDTGMELADLAALPEPIADPNTESSFVKDVVPILAQRCGRCHVDRNRGEFSAKSFDSLMDSTHVSAGRPDTSRLIEVIAEGSMPPNGNVPDEEVAALKRWIRLGAKFDGDDPGKSLREFAAGNQPGQPMENNLEALKPTGSETVSFGRDVAPILLENCSGCHIGGRRIRGNLNMANFAGMLRGGDSGSPVAAGVPKESLIVQRLRGIDSDVMPPQKKLSEAKIKIIETWIAEGAKFDGEALRTEIATVAKVAATNAKGHSDVVAERDAIALKNWKLIMSSGEAQLQSTNNFRVIGSDQRQEVGELAEQLATEIGKAVGANEAEPFIKGNTTIYLFEKRYDLNELGMMLINRELDKSQTGRWDFTTVDSYAALLMKKSGEVNELKPQLIQQLTAIWLSSRSPGTPRWFADATGYLIASKLDRKNPVVRQWQDLASTISKNLEDPTAFARGKLNERDAGLAGLAFMDSLKSGGTLKRLMKSLADGEEFDAAFAAATGKTPDEYFKPPRRGRR